MNFIEFYVGLQVFKQWKIRLNFKELERVRWPELFKFDPFYILI